ncbi:MAG: hypothetical protein M0Z95_09935, partial [Actinomycetota bacterium]|nr:hypothetical protein [Actinomycetota bacterium]
AALALLVSTAVNIVNSPVLAAASPRAVPLWQTISVPGRLHPGTMLLLTDGAVMVQDQGPSNSGAPGWWLLTPNSMDSYVDGSWRQIASLPTGYGPISFASAVLPDGRDIIEGGEDNLGHTGALTNLGAVYQPLTNHWTSVEPPVGATWGTIGDAPSVVLANGTFMLGGSGNYTNKSQALLDPSTLTWTKTGTGQVDNNEEEGFTLLPIDKVLAVGLRRGVTPDPGYAEVYDPTSGTWSEAGTFPVPVVTSGGDEIGPQVLLPNGTVLVVGDTGQNAVFDVATGGWSGAPSFPVINGQQIHVADGPAAVLPDGDVLIDASPGLYHTPSYFFVFNGSTVTRVQGPPYAASLESNWGYMLVLPTGQVLFNDRVGQMEVYNGGGAPNASWMPVISRVPRDLAPAVPTRSPAGSSTASPKVPPTARLPERDRLPARPPYVFQNPACRLCPDLRHVVDGGHAWPAFPHPLPGAEGSAGRSGNGRRGRERDRLDPLAGHGQMTVGSSASRAPSRARGRTFRSG